MIFYVTGIYIASTDAWGKIWGIVFTVFGLLLIILFIYIHDKSVKTSVKKAISTTRRKLLKPKVLDYPYDVEETYENMDNYQ
jgi:predicted membrane protein